jgi:hypothetical protein
MNVFSPGIYTQPINHRYSAVRVNKLYITHNLGVYTYTCSWKISASIPLVGKYQRNYLGENKSKRGSENEKKIKKIKRKGADV